MPTYDYECSKCGHRFEKFEKMSDAPLKQCPKCKGKVHRLIGGGSGIIFKGTGFYETDYKKKTSPGAGGSSCGSSDSCKGCPKSDKK